MFLKYTLSLTPCAFIFQLILILNLSLDNPQAVPVMMRAKVDKLMELKNEDNQYKKYEVCTEFLQILCPSMHFCKLKYLIDLF